MKKEILLLIKIQSCTKKFEGKKGEGAKSETQKKTRE
jgi:hypothetical protein